MAIDEQQVIGITVTRGHGELAHSNSASRRQVEVIAVLQHPARRL
jgi:hypothetical protein